MTERSILETRDLCLDLGEKRILDNLSLQFWPGYVHAVVGPNGAGKSTLANTIMGLSGYTGFSGDVVFEGESLKGLAIDQRARKGITLAWQEPARYEGLKVESFIGAGIIVIIAGILAVIGACLWFAFMFANAETY